MSSLGVQCGPVSLANLRDIILKRSEALREQDLKAACECSLPFPSPLSRSCA